MIPEMGFMPLITKPITDHTATLIDHIYTNVPEKVINAGICTADITDLPK
jgi:Ni,Fe-hydrogenase III small subunit